jgi:hypothetical protein
MEKRGGKQAFSGSSNGSGALQSAKRQRTSGGSSREHLLAALPTATAKVRILSCLRCSSSPKIVVFVGGCGDVETESPSQVGGVRVATLGASSADICTFGALGVSIALAGAAKAWKGSIFAFGVGSHL